MNIRIKSYEKQSRVACNIHLFIYLVMILNASQGPNIDSKNKTEMRRVSGLEIKESSSPSFNLRNKDHSNQIQSETEENKPIEQDGDSNIDFSNNDAPNVLKLTRELEKTLFVAKRHNSTNDSIESTVSKTSILSILNCIPRKDDKCSIPYTTNISKQADIDHQRTNYDFPRKSNKKTKKEKNKVMNPTRLNLISQGLENHIQNLSSIIKIFKNSQSEADTKQNVLILRDNVDILEEKLSSTKKEIEELKKWIDESVSV